MTQGDDLGRVVIPKEIRRTLRIREGGPLLTTLIPIDSFCMAIHAVGIFDSKYFAKLFKLETGLTPAEYRRQQRRPK